MIGDDIVEAMVSLPAKLFVNTQIEVCFWILNKDKKNKGKTLFINAKNLASQNPEERKQLIINEKNMKLISNTINAWRQNKDYKDVTGFCKSADYKEIENNYFDLSPSYYVGIDKNGLNNDNKNGSDNINDLLKDIAKEKNQIDKDFELLMKELNKIKF